MNKACTLQNWKHGGKHYVLNATSHNQWVGFQETVIDKLKKKFGNEFYLVVWGNKQEENDFYKIPFKKLKHLFTDEHKTTGNLKNRWTATIVDRHFLMHSNSKLAIDINDDYGNLHKDFISGWVKDDLAYIELEHEYFEGEKKDRLSSYYERNPKLRSATIKEQGLTCKICGFNFEDFYGDVGIGFIEVHHLTPISILNPDQKLCPVNDMVVVCANCHRMFHRNKNETLTIEQVKCLIEK